MDHTVNRLIKKAQNDGIKDPFLANLVLACLERAVERLEDMEMGQVGGPHPSRAILEMDTLVDDAFHEASENQVCPFCASTPSQRGDDLWCVDPECAIFNCKFTSKQWNQRALC